MADGDGYQPDQGAEFMTRQMRLGAKEPSQDNAVPSLLGGEM
jgi:hypothetical protein